MEVSDPGDGMDAAKYVSGLSTLLVATIQEAKDRISQIEYIFCSQLYPNFQKSSKSLQKLCSEARRAAEEKCKQRECQLEQALEDCNVLKADKLKLSRRIAELEKKLSQTIKEAEDGMELHGKLIHVIETKDSIIINQEKQVKELQEKVGELTQEKKLNQELLRQIESQTLKITGSEQKMVNVEMENNQLKMELRNVAASLDDFRDELRRRSVELEEGNKLRQQLIQQVNLNGLELTKKDQQLSALEGEKKLLLSRISDLENKVEVLEENLKGGVSAISVMSKRSESHDDLLQQIQLKNAKLTEERQKNRNVIAAYKKLKSQHNFLLSKVPLNKEDVQLPIKFEEESDPLNHDTPPEIKDRTPASNVVAGQLIEVKREIDSKESSNDEKGVRLNQSNSSPSPSSSKSVAAACWISNRKILSTGTKRSASGWRDTRSCQSPGGPDPHDDFLDTPYENIRGNLHKVKDFVPPEIPAQVSKDMVSDGSDDETQDMQAESGSKKQQLQASMPGSKGYKYVEPVRKKSERENLNGIECKQCKKFYDAILPDAVDKNGEVDQQNFRCEHHDGVSRHRYKYVPPMTPEGFWNIGFDSET